MFLSHTKHIKIDFLKKIRIIKFLWSKLSNSIDFNIIKSSLTEF